MTDPDNGLYAVVGATGQQGNAAVRALLATGQRVRALVRDVDSVAAGQLATAGAELVHADLDDPPTLGPALTGIAGLFAMTTYSDERGTDGEIQHGLTLARAAADADVPHVVYSSVGGAERRTGIPHFESKFRIEQEFSATVPVRFVRPTFFMENFSRFRHATAAEQVIRLPMAADLSMQLVAVHDIGRAAAALLVAPDRIAGSAIEIAGDELTMSAVAGIFADQLGTQVRFEEVPLDALGDDQDRKAMFRWFAAPPSYLADRAGTRALIPEVLSLVDWLRTG